MKDIQTTTLKRYFLIGMSNKNSSKSGILTQLMEGQEYSGQHEQYVVADDSSSLDTPSLPTSPTISSEERMLMVIISQRQISM